MPRGGSRHRSGVEPLGVTSQQSTAGTKSRFNRVIQNEEQTRAGNYRENALVGDQMLADVKLQHARP